MSDDIVQRLRSQEKIVLPAGTQIAIHGGTIETIQDIAMPLPAGDRLEAAAKIERLLARVKALEKTLKHAASVSHNGGLVGFSEHDALIAVRRLTLAYWGREHGEAARATVIAALEAQP